MLNHISHSQPVLDYVASLKVPVIVGPIYETQKPTSATTPSTVFRPQLQKRGVKDRLRLPTMPTARATCPTRLDSVAFGLPYDEALKAITLNPAEIWGVADNSARSMSVRQPT